VKQSRHHSGVILSPAAVIGADPVVEREEYRESESDALGVRGDARPVSSTI
jgi:hypothetical protein